MLSRVEREKTVISLSQVLQCSVLCSFYMSNNLEENIIDLVFGSVACKYVMFDCQHACVTFFLSLFMVPCVVSVIVIFPIHVSLIIAIEH